MKTLSKGVLLSFLFLVIGTGQIFAEKDYREIFQNGKDITEHDRIEGQWYGFYSDADTNEHVIFDISFFQTAPKHVVAYWKMVNEHGVVFNRGVSEGDIGKDGLWLFDLDPNPVRSHYIRILSDKTILGMYREHNKDKISKPLGYYLVFKN